MYNQTNKRWHNRYDATAIKKALCFVFVSMYVFGGFSKLYAQKSFIQRGIASYYTDRFDGRKTASGEIFDNRELVGSHKKLPFNTMVKVTNLANKRSVVVRINDRGPYAHGRIIDVSKSAANLIGLYATGTAKVLIQAVGRDGVVTKETPKKITPISAKKITTTVNTNSKTTRASVEKDFKIGKTYDAVGFEKTPHGYGVQVAYFTTLASAKKQCGEVTGATNIQEVFIQVGWDNKKQRKIYRVMVGSFANKSASSLTQRQLRRGGFKGFLARHHLK
ncbi:SPOR domain-containing protein [uncultured Microscilla sp.]|uniref:septal ring lytic transglycosylase RlpA family protein n=1 Tax=uncultured Microscilla sp. TaxID=432653 RepID=UPI0026040275|nr:SPOR domain-containing protein [uncultured Microscilla sp.]